MSEGNDFALVPKRLSAVEKAAPGAKRRMSGIMAETLALAEAKSLVKLSPNKSPLLESWCQKGESCVKRRNTGRGVPQDHVEAAKWFRMAAEKGHAWGQYRLGEFYRTGLNSYYVDTTPDVLLRDRIEAEKWLRKAAEQGLAEAQFSLARCYMRVDWVSKDDQEALRWLNKAAEQGLAESQNFLARFYMAGRGVPQDYHEAIRWLTKAAEQNHRNAKVRIAECYQALGNLVEAFKWLMLASDQDNLWKEDLNSLRPLLTKEQIAEAEKRYRQFQSSKK